MLSNCGHDENWGYAGGMAGDNNGTEWQLVNWYSYPWQVMIRYPNAEVRHWMGNQSQAAALNNCMGYDQWQRGTFWTNLADSDYDAAQVTVLCETDCSAGVLAICKAAGYHFNIEPLKKINQWGTTWGMVDILSAAGFEIHREIKYLTSDNYLDNGDILLNIENHTAFNVTRGCYCDADEKHNVPSSPINDKGLWYKCHVQTYGDLPWVRDGMIAGTEGQKKRMEGLWINPPVGVELEVDIHLQTVGWNKEPIVLTHGNNILLGSTGLKRRMEAIRIRCRKNDTGLNLFYQVHCQHYGTMNVCKEGEIAGTTGESKRMESIKIYLK